MLKTKKLLIVALCALLVVSLGVITSLTLKADDPALTVGSYTLDYDAAAADRQITVTVSLPADANYAIAAARFGISFNPTVLSPVYTAGGKLDCSLNVSDVSLTRNLESISATESILRFAFAGDADFNYQTTSDATAVLVRIKMTVVDGASVGSYPLTISFPAASDNVSNAASQVVPTSLVSGSLTINAIPVTYSTAVTGQTEGVAAVGTELTAAPTAIADARTGNETTYAAADIADYLSYQWYRGGTAITGATAATYTPTADDVAAAEAAVAGGGSGAILTAGITCTGNYTCAETLSAAVTPTRAAFVGTAPTPVLASRTTTSVTLKLPVDSTYAIGACEFRLGTDGTWQTSPTFTGLTAATGYTFYTRIAQTGTTTASAAGAASATIYTQRTVTGTLTIDDTTPVYGQALTAVTTGLDAAFAAHGLTDAEINWYRGSVSAANLVAGNTSAYTTVEADVGKDLILTVTAADDYSDDTYGFTGTVTSASFAVAKAPRAAAPAAPTVYSTGTGYGYQYNRDADTADIHFGYLCEPGQEYRILQGTETFVDWYHTTAATAQAISHIVEPNVEYTVEARYIETSCYLAGASTEIASAKATSEKMHIYSSLCPSSMSCTYNQSVTADITVTTLGNRATTNSAAAQAALTYQWYIGEVDITGATAASYTPVASDIGKVLRVIITPGAGFSWSGGTFTSTGVVGKAATVAPAAPTLVSNSHSGSYFTVVFTPTGTQYAYTDDTAATLSWEDNPAGNVTLTSVAPNHTYYIYCRYAETATNLASAASTALTATTDKRELTGAPVISVSGGGDAEWGKTLTVSATAVVPAASHDDLTYTWYAGSDVVGTGLTYPMVVGDLGKSITCVVTIEDDTSDYTTTGLTSNALTCLARTIGGSVSMSGTNAEWGTVQTAVVTSVTETAAQTGLTYSWKLGSTEKGTADTYTPDADAVGSSLTLTVTGTGNYRGTLTSAAITILKQTVTALPTITGSPTFGNAVTAVITALPTAAQTGVTYQWYRADTQTGTGTAITGATAASYTITAADIGKWLSVEVTIASGNAAYRGSVRSAALEGGKEIISATVTVTGAAKFGTELTAAVGSLTPAAATYTIEWYRGTTLIKSGDGTVTANRKYTPVEADIGSTIKVTVTGTGSYTGTVSSDPTATVTKADAPAAPPLAVFKSKTYNSITVTGLAGCCYRVGDGAWSGVLTADGDVTFTGLTRNTAYVITGYIPASATRFASAVSAGLDVTTDRQPIGGSVAISGTPVFDGTLSAVVSAVAPAGVTYSYAWTYGDTAATCTTPVGAGALATGSSCALTVDHVGKYIKLTLTGTGDFTGTISAVTTATVAKATGIVPAAPTQVSKTYQQIVFAKTGDQYAYTDDTTATLSWEENPAGDVTLTGLLPNHTYYIYCRTTETATHLTGAASTALTVKTEKQPLTGLLGYTNSAIGATDVEYSDTITAGVGGVQPAASRMDLTYNWTVGGVSFATGSSAQMGAEQIGETVVLTATAGADSDYTGSLTVSFAVYKKTISGSIGVTGTAQYGETLTVTTDNLLPAAARSSLLFELHYYDPVSQTWGVYVITNQQDISLIARSLIGKTVRFAVAPFSSAPYRGYVYGDPFVIGKKLIGGTVSIDGTVRYGSTVTLNSAVTPSGTAAGLTNQWYLDGVAVTGATGTSFAINDPTMIGKTLTVKQTVTAVNSSYTGSVTSAGTVIGKTLNPATTVAPRVLATDKTTLTVEVVAGQIYSIDGGLSWTDASFNGTFTGLKPGTTYQLQTKVPGDETTDDSETLSLSVRTDLDIVDIRYVFENGPTCRVAGPESILSGTAVSVTVLLPEGYAIDWVYDAYAFGGVSVAKTGDNSFTFVAGEHESIITIVLKTVAIPVAPSAPIIVSTPSTVSTPSSTVTSGQPTSSESGSDITAPEMGSAAGTGAALLLALGLSGAAAILIDRKRRTR